MGHIDHVSREFDAWVFLHEGLDIYTTPRKDFLKQYVLVPDNIGWITHPSYYPPGIIIITIPFSLLSYYFLLPQIIVHKLHLAFLTLFAFIDIYLITKWYVIPLIKRSRLENVLDPTLLFSKLFFIESACVSLIFLSMNGYYESIPLLSILYCIKKYNEKNYSASIVFFSIGFFLKYQAIFLISIVAACIWKLGKSKILAKQKYLIIPALILITLTILLGKTNISTTSAKDINSYSFFLDEPVTSSKSMLFMLITILMLVALINKKEWIVSGVMITTLYCMYILTFFRPWYYLWFLPLIIYKSRVKEKIILIFWLIIHMTFYGL